MIRFINKNSGIKYLNLKENKGVCVMRFMMGFLYAKKYKF